MDCHRPIRLVCDGFRDEPAGMPTCDHDAHQRLVPCGSRLTSECPPCAARWMRNARIVLGSGLATVAPDELAIFVTVTSPGVDLTGSRVHTSRWDPQRQEFRPCRVGVKGKCPKCGNEVRCNRAHLPDDP